jgi:hypothetical protein
MTVQSENIGSHKVSYVILYVKTKRVHLLKKGEKNMYAGTEF